MINEKGLMSGLIAVKPRVLIGILHTVPEVHQIFNLHKCDYIAQNLGTYSEEIMRKFNAYYVATLRRSID